MVLLYAALEVTTKQVNDGDLKRAEAMLINQAEALSSIFTNFSRRALAQQYQNNFESFFRMALKAQNQCRMTLATIKNPPIVYAKQANISSGPQQVNNGTAVTHAEKIKISQMNYWRYCLVKGWTQERRARQAKLINQWKPWNNSTGPRTESGKAELSRNAFKGGHRAALRELSRLIRECEKARQQI